MKTLPCSKLSAPADDSQLLREPPPATWALIEDVAVHAGYGKCYKCNCRKFEGFTDQCGNCGHRYSDHY